MRIVLIICILIFKVAIVPAQNILEWHTLRSSNTGIDIREINSYGNAISLLFDSRGDSILLDQSTICTKSPPSSEIEHMYLLLLDSLNQSQLKWQFTASPYPYPWSHPITSLNIEKTCESQFTFAYYFGTSDSLYLNDSILHIENNNKGGLGLLNFKNTGEIIFNKRFPGHSINAVSIASLPGNKIVIAGIFNLDSIVLDDYHLHCEFCHAEDCDVFIAILDSLGNVLNAKRYGGNYWDYANGLVTDTDGNIYLAGTTYSQYFMVDSTAIHNNAYWMAGDPYLLKINSNLDLLWYKQIAGNSDETGKRLIKNAEGNIYMSGYIIGAYATIDADTLWGGNPGYYNPYIVKFTSDGSLAWYKTFTSYSSFSFISDISIDAGDNLWLSISYNSSISVDGNLLVAAGIVDNALVQFSPEGNYKQMYILENTSGQQIKSLDGDRLFVADKFIGTDSLNFLNMTIHSLYPDDNPYFYFTLQLPPVGTNAPLRPMSRLNISPNPLHSGSLLHIDFSSEPGESTGRIEINDCIGRRIAQYPWPGDTNSIQLPFTLKPGMYFISFRSGGALIAKKIVVVD